MASSSSPPRPMIYACIAYGLTLLAESSAGGGSHAASSLASLVLARVDRATPQKLTYVHGNHHIHYASEPTLDGGRPAAAPTDSRLAFILVAEDSLPRRVAFTLLLDVCRRFLAEFPPTSFDLATLPNYGAAAFNAELKRLMAEYAAQDDAVASVRREIDDVRGIMSQNIEGLLERGERMDLLVDKTDRLGGSAREFRVRSRGLRRQLWWKNVKLMALLTVVAILVVLAIFLSLRAA